MPRCLQLLVRAGCALDARDAEGRTPLLLAAKHGNVRAAHELLRLGADLGAVDAYGWNALHVAAHEGHCAMARCLAKWDSDARALVRARNSAGKRPCDVARTQRVRDELDTLWWACARARLDLVRRMARAQQHVDLPRPWPVLYRSSTCSR